MKTITSTEFQKNIQSYSDIALQEPAIITSHNRDHLVLIGMDEYNRLKELEEEMNTLTPK